MPFQATLPERPTVPQVRSALLGAGEYLHGLRSKAPDERGEGFAEDVRSATSFINDYDAVLTALVKGSEEGEGPTRYQPLTNPGARSLGSLVADSDTYKDLIGRSGAANATHVAIDIDGSPFRHTNGMYQRATVTSADNTTGGAGGLLPQGDPIAPIPRQRRLFIRDVLNVIETGLSSVPYVREYEPITNETGASSVSENAAKPEVTMEWESDDAPIRKVAGWVPVTTEIIEDVDTLMGYIDGRLAYMVAVREEQQVLNGSGTAPQLKGILQYSGVQTQASAATKAETLGLAIGKVESVDGEVDGIAMTPTNYWEMITARHSDQFDGGFGTGAPGAIPFQSVWGVPVIRSRAISADTAIVGSWALGATLFDRMQTTIRVGNQHSDFFTNNKIAILAEERVGLAVHRPDHFVNATLA